MNCGRKKRHCSRWEKAAASRTGTEVSENTAEKTTGGTGYTA